MRGRGWFIAVPVVFVVTVCVFFAARRSSFTGSLLQAMTNVGSTVISLSTNSEITVEPLMPMSTKSNSLHAFKSLCPGSPSRPQTFHSSYPSVALMVQGPCQDPAKCMFSGWVRLLERMTYGHNITLFFLTDDVPINKSTCVTSRGQVRCIFFPKSDKWTWTKGRNALTLAAFDDEESRMVEYEHWIHVDVDFLDVRCMSISDDISECWDDFVERLFLFQLPTLSGVNWNPEMNGFPEVYNATYRNFFMFSPCSDAALQAFHRQAVIVMMPYVSALDNNSWWMSQALQFPLTKGCFPGNNGVFNFNALDNRHSEYPQGRDYKLELRHYEEVYKNITPWPTKYFRGDQGCEENIEAATYRTRGFLDPVAPNASLSWTLTKEYTACVDFTLPRFCEFVTRRGAEAIQLKYY